MKRLKQALLLALFLVGNHAQAQTSGTEYPLDWHMLSFEEDSVYGSQVYKAYDFLKGRKPAKKVVVALIGGGFDVMHEDLADNVWRNTGETPGDGIDNDANGYADDIHGWNFLGLPDGRMIMKTTRDAERYFEANRLRYDELYDKARTVAEDTELRRMKEIFSLTEVGRYFLAISTAKELMPRFESINEEFTSKFPAAQDRTPDNLITLIDKNEPDTLRSAAFTFAYLSMVYGKTWEQFYQSKEDYIVSAREFYQQERGDLSDDRVYIGDDESDPDDRFYGNPNLFVPGSDLGTHVAGVVGAVRNNGVGVDGIADNVELMYLRAVGSGDEYDKDIAVAIRYAVDNGADIIVMTFGKHFSLDPDIVSRAMKYAEQKNVLLVHAAGNSGIYTDVYPVYPQGVGPDGNRLNNYIRVGNSGPGGQISPMTNYGSSSVDIFAPGIDIYSTTASDNYGLGSSSAIAAGVVGGIAAIMRSYYPSLTTPQISEILMESATVRHGGEVTLPQNEQSSRVNKVSDFTKVSRAGGIVSAFEAIKRADQLNKKRKKK